MWNDELDESQKLRVPQMLHSVAGQRMTGILKVIQSVQTSGTSYPNTTMHKTFISYLTESNMFLHSKDKISSAVQQNKSNGISGPHSFTPQFEALTASHHN